MLTFVTSLRHPHNSADYGRVERILERTLASICRQQAPEFSVVVVGNRVPRFTLPDKVEFVQVDFPPPSAEETPQIEMEAFRYDKGTKLAIALLAARRHAPDHIMPVDADDYVSRRIASFVSRHPRANGWYVTDGYVYSHHQRIARRVPRFYEASGTCLIIRYDLYSVPDLPVTATQEEVWEGFGAFTVRELLSKHRPAVEHFASVGAPLEPLPFPGAVYAVGTGENRSGRRDLEHLGWPVGRRLAAEFGLPAATADPRPLLHGMRGAAKTLVRRARHR